MRIINQQHPAEVEESLQFSIKDHRMLIYTDIWNQILRLKRHLLLTLRMEIKCFLQLS